MDQQKQSAKSEDMQVSSTAEWGNSPVEPRSLGIRDNVRIVPAPTAFEWMIMLYLALAPTLISQTFFKEAIVL